MDAQAVSQNTLSKIGLAGEQIGRQLARANYDPDSQSEFLKQIGESREALKALLSEVPELSRGQSVVDNLRSFIARDYIHRRDCETEQHLRRIIEVEEAPDYRRDIYQKLKQVEFVDSLGMLGFSQVGTSAFYLKDNFLVSESKEGAIRIFVPLDTSSKNSEEFLIRGVNSEDRASLTVISLTDKYKRANSYFDGGSSSGPCDEEFLLQSKEMSTQEQLLEAGFTEIDAGVFAKQDKEFLRDTETVLAIVDQEKIVHVMKEIHPVFSKMITPDTRITGFGSAIRWASSRDEREDVMTLTNDTIEFKITDSGYISNGSQWLFRELSPSEVGLTPIVAKKEKSGFLIGGVNASESIEQLESIGGVSFSSEDLSKQQMLRCNDLVLNHGYTHQEIGQMLKYAQLLANGRFGGFFEYKNQLFNVVSTGFTGSWKSKFSDGSASANVYRLTNINNGKSITFKGIVPGEIERYGYYGEYQPAEIFELFELEAREAINPTDHEDLSIASISERKSTISFDDAMEYICNLQRLGYDQEKYFEALTSISENLDLLPFPVYFELPGGLGGNADSKWDDIRASSVERCSCGNERMFMPETMRKEFLPSASERVINFGEKINFKPVGGDKASTYLQIEITEHGMEFLPTPFAPLVLTPDMFSRKGFELEALANAVAIQKTPPVMTTTVGEFTIPLFGLKAVNTKSKSITITKDVGIEIFTDQDEVRVHTTH